MGSLVQYVQEPGRLTAVWRSSTLDPRPEVWLTFEQFRPDRGRVQAEVTVESHLGLRPIRMGLTLQSETGRTELRRACEDLIPGGKGYWKVRVDSSCWHVVDALRQGERAIDLSLVTPRSATRWLVDRWIPWGLPTVVYGDGDTGKSLFALAVALHARLGVPLGGDPNWRLTPVSGVLYLDWEADAEDHASRLHALARGLNLPVPTEVFYRRMAIPLPDAITDLVAEIHRTGIDLVVIDSVSAAAGGELEGSEVALAYSRAVRQLPCTNLAVGHIPKAQAFQPGPRTQLFGSVQFRNQVRSAIELRRDDTEEQHRITLRLDKANLCPAPRPPVCGWAFTNGDGRLGIIPAAADEGMRSLRSRILEALRAGISTPTDLAETLVENRDTVKKTLQRLEKLGHAEPKPGQAGGRGQERQWIPVDKTGTRNQDTRDISEDEVPF